MPATSLNANQLAASNCIAGIEVPKETKAPSAFNLREALSSAQNKKLFFEKNEFEKLVVIQAYKLSARRFIAHVVHRMGD